MFPTKAFFISDLHLSQNIPKVALLLQHFLDQIMQSGDSLYILGDFFEYWLGEDLMDNIQKEALLKLRKLQSEGSQIYFIQGNRDFLIRKKTLSAYGITLLKDPCLITLLNKKILLSHGDHLCTLDQSYQRYRRLTRMPFIQQLFLRLPRKIRTAIAEKIHAQNPHGSMLKNPDYKIADATPEAIQKELDYYQPDIFIYGHVHRQGIYYHDTKTRMVLGDWCNTGNYIEITENKVEAKIFSFD